MSLQTVIIASLTVGAISVMWNYEKLRKIYTGLTLFSPSTIAENFRSMPTLWPHTTIRAAGSVAKFTGSNKQLDLPENFVFDGKLYNLKNWLASQCTTGLVVLKIWSATEAQLMHESYYLGNSADSKVISWSVNKSVVSALVGIAIAEGKIKSIDSTVTDYVPELAGSGYDGVKIKDVLQMSSGVKFNEDYASFVSDINMMSYWLAMGFDISSFIKTLGRDNEPGTVFNYISADTQVLGMILTKATGQTLTEYLGEKIWSKCGFEGDCKWLVDNEKSKTELAFGSLNASTRDYARFGWLFLNNGLSPLDGTRIIESDWIAQSIDCSEPHLRPDYPKKIGYGYQWWCPGTEAEPTKFSTDYLGIGVYNQFVYINPVDGIVIAKNSANHKYNEQENSDGSNQGEIEAVAAFRAISAYFS